MNNAPDIFDAFRVRCKGKHVNAAVKKEANMDYALERMVGEQQCFSSSYAGPFLHGLGINLKQTANGRPDT